MLLFTGFITQSLEVDHTVALLVSAADPVRDDLTCRATNIRTYIRMLCSEWVPTVNGVHCKKRYYELWTHILVIMLDLFHLLSSPDVN